MTTATAGRLAGVASLCGGSLLALGTVRALLTPELPAAAKLATIVIIALTMWRPGAGLVATIAIAPAGLLLAASPARAAELLVWAFLAAWLLRTWRAQTKDPSTTPLTAARVFGACAMASWAGYTIAGATGIEWLYLPAHLARTLGADHLVFSAPEPETFALLDLLAGLGLFAAAAVLTRGQPDLRRQIALAIVAACAVLSVLTVADVLRQWAELDYGAWFLLRFPRGERFSFHLPDLNAAGSQYVLGGLIAAALAVTDRARRSFWLGLLVVAAPGFYLSGSRAATLGGLLAGGALIPLLSRRIVLRVSPARVFLLLLLGMAAVGGAVAAAGGKEQGTAANSLWIRSQFLVTSTRMVASAPVFGVGIGHYHERSNEFMPPALREIYRHENAHNYFAQQFAEMGVIGGVLFAWLAIAVVRSGWTQVWESANGEPATLALLAGCVGYLLTCATGHPLLVPEAALPFWGAFGALASTAPAVRMRRALVGAVLLVLAFGVVLAVRRYALADTQPGEQGFYAIEKTGDGTPFVWMTRHGVFYVNPQPGTLAIPVQAPDFLRSSAPFRVDVDVAGRRSGTYEVPPGQWTTIEIPIRQHASAAFRRVDVRANRSWTPKNERDGGDEGPRSVMVGTTRFTSVGGR